MVTRGVLQENDSILLTTRYLFLGRVTRDGLRGPNLE